MGIIYKATNLVNNKCYIGKTVQDLRVRKTKHKSDALSNKYNMYFHKSIIKHGFNNFKWEVITNIYDENKLSAAEKFYIAAYKSMGYKLYNMTDGGEGMSGHIMNKESRRKMSEAKKDYIPWNKGIKYPKELCKKFSEAQKKAGNSVGEKNPMYGVRLFGKLNPMYGKKRPDIIERNKKNNPAVKKPVINLDTGEKFESAKKAADFYNISYESVGSVCRGKRKTACGYRWAFI